MPSTLTSSLPRAVLWDLDGTLIDTAPVHWQAWRATLAAEGFDLTWEIFAPTFGQRNDTTLQTWLGMGITPAEIQRISDAKEARYRSTLRTTRLSPLPGAEHWLTTLRAAGWRQALATMSWRENLDAIFAALDFDFRQVLDVIVTAGEVQRGKPDPEIFLRAAERLGVSPERCIVVEDAPAGLEAARCAGMRSIGVSAKAWLAARLNADYTAPSLLALPANCFDRLIPAGKDNP